jgi:hypothetical protein
MNPPTRRRRGATCFRCGGRIVERIPVWAIVLAVILFPLGLLFLLVKERRCVECG